MEYKLFSLDKAQKKGSAQVDNTADKLITVLVVIILVVSLAGTMFTYTGSGATGFANSSVNGGAPTWLVTLFPILLAIAILYIILKVIKSAK